MDLTLIEKKIKWLVNKLNKKNISLQVFSPDDIEFGPLIGKGGEGIVQKCTIHYNELPIAAAVKTITNDSEDALDIVLAEIEYLCLAHDPIVRTTQTVYGVAAVPDKMNSKEGRLVIITELGLKNALQLYQSEEVPLCVTFDLWSRLAAAIHCIHTKQIIHQDLKPENILITRIDRDKDGEITNVAFKIIDMGMARLCTVDVIPTIEVIGTNGYHAPEMLFEKTYDNRADIFMLGITFLVLLLPSSSLSKKSLQNLLKKIDDRKKKKTSGKTLFNCISSDLSVKPSSQITNMICSMLEPLVKRCVTLLDIVTICSSESLKHRTKQNSSDVPLNYGLNLQQDSGVHSIEYSYLSESDDHQAASSCDSDENLYAINRDKRSSQMKATTLRSIKRKTLDGADEEEEDDERIVGRQTYRRASKKPRLQ